MHYSVVRSLQPCPQLTDRLALERTRLTNERTLRAYLRSGLTLVIAGFTLINFFRENLCVWVDVVGVAVTVGDGSGFGADSAAFGHRFLAHSWHSSCL